MVDSRVVDVRIGAVSVEVWKNLFAVESPINQVVSKRFVKKQQMQWTPKEAHLLLQTRTRVLDGDLDAVFRGWYPQFRPEPAHR